MDALSVPRRIEVVGGALIDNGRLLAALRGPSMRDAGLWELAGGKVEPGETPEAALAREWTEELGVEITVGECLGTVVDDRIRLTLFAVALRSGRPRALEHAELRWVRPGEWEGMQWHDTDRALLHGLAARIGYN